MQRIEIPKKKSPERKFRAFLFIEINVNESDTRVGGEETVYFPAADLATEKRKAVSVALREVCTMAVVEGITADDSRRIGLQRRHTACQHMIALLLKREIIRVGETLHPHPILVFTEPSVYDRRIGDLVGY